MIEALRGLLGPRGLLEGADTAASEQDWRGLYRGRTEAVIRPGDAAELASAVRLCAAHGTALVPQGGNTSLVGGATPPADGSALVVSLARMRGLRAIDPAGLTMTVEAGMTLRAAQDHADTVGCLLPLSISAEGSATIGGVLATNAGGNNTVRYGNARDLTLGLEVVLPDGQIWDGLRRLRKDNTGYCLRQLFVGSEGTLGIITAAVLRLVPRPTERVAALCGLASTASALDLLGRVQRTDAAGLLAFEYISGVSMALVLALIEGAVLPLEAPAGHYVLVELAGGEGARAGLEAVLTAALEEGVVEDAVIAESEARRLALWRLREEQAEAHRRAGASVKNDVSVPVDAVPALLDQASAAVAAVVPGVRIAPFGHLGDGNIHFNLVQPEEADVAGFLAQSEALMAAVNTVVRRLEGSFSAEHGIGQLKTQTLADWRGGVELGLMRAIKAAIDPGGLMNPGKMLEG